ncbi:MAG: hypothetical protein M0Z66_11260 [Thermaerobacter sp.]|nr:hypothetical protein [Thermaerobacter sp.]
MFFTMRQFRPLDLLHLRAVVDAAIAPGGEEFTYELAAGDGSSVLWRGYENAGDPRPLTRGPHDHKPRYAPDQTQIAFLRGEGGASQIYLLDRRGGEAMPFTRLRFGVCDFAWSPDSRAIAAVTPIGPEGPLPLAADADAHPAPAGAVHALLLMQMDGTWRQLSPDGVDCAHPAFSADGRRIACLVRRPRDPAACLAGLPTDGGIAQCLVPAEFAPGPADFSPDGALAFAAQPIGALAPALYTVSAAGGEPQPYGTALPEGLAPTLRQAPVYAADGGSLYTLLGEDGTWRLAEVRPQGDYRLRTPAG